MHFSAHTDIDAPVGFVYEALSDFDAWERLALRRGIDLVRTDGRQGAIVGATWDLRFAFRGKSREIAIKLTEQNHDAKLALTGEGRMLQAVMGAELVPLSPKRTRLTINCELTPRTLGGRLFLQSARLGKGRIQTKINNRLSQFGLELEQRYTAPAR